MPIRLVLPLPKNLGNARMSHWVKHRHRREYMERLDLIQLATESQARRGTATPKLLTEDLFTIPEPPPSPFGAALISAHYVVRNLMDDDNAMARAKWPLDWLVRRGFLVDDSRKFLRWEGIPTQELSRRDKSRLILTVTPIAEMPPVDPTTGRM